MPISRRGFYPRTLFSSQIILVEYLHKFFVSVLLLEYLLRSPLQVKVKFDVMVYSRVALMVFPTEPAGKTVLICRFPGVPIKDVMALQILLRAAYGAPFYPL